MEMEFHLCEGVLHFGDVCLYRSPHDVRVSSSLECLRAIARHAILSQTDVNGLSNHCAECSLSALDAICALVHRGHGVRIETATDPSPDARPHVVDGVHRIPVHTTWSVASLLGTPVDTVECDQTVHPRCDRREEGFTVLVRHDDLGVPLAIRETLFHTVVTSPSYVLRVSHDASGVPRLARYLDCVLSEVETLDVGAPCGTFLIDERGTFDAHADGVASEALRPVARVLLRAPEMVPVVASSPILGRLLTAFATRRWNVQLREMWTSGTDETLLNTLRRTDTPDCIALCIDPVLLFEKRRRQQRTDVLGMTLLRRLECCDATRYVDMRASMMANQGVVRVEVLPIARTRFERLHDIGAFNGEVACRSGVVLGTETRILCVPFDSSPPHVADAVRTLLLGREEEPNLTGMHPLLRFEFGVVYQESASRCTASETLVSYRLLVDGPSRTLQLVGDVDERFETEDVLSVDELERLTVPCDPARTRRRDVADLFPEMTKRVEVTSSENVSACLREIQGRRVTREWTLDSVDAGHNMSSVGLALLMHLLLSQWLGARCRIAQSRSGAAMVAVHIDGVYRLVDPCRTLRNLFTLAPSCSSSSYASTPTPSVGMMVEISPIGNCLWHLSIVRSVTVDEGIMVVEVVQTRRRTTVSLGGQKWRRVGQDASDTDQIVRGFLRDRQLKRDRTSKRERDLAQELESVRQCARGESNDS